MLCSTCGSAVLDKNESLCRLCRATVGLKEPCYQGRSLYVPDGAVLPGYCFACGEPVGDERTPVALRCDDGGIGHHGPNVVGLISVVGRAALAERVVVQAPYCPRHKSTWGALKTSGAIVLAGAIAWAIVICILEERAPNGKGPMENLVRSGLWLAIPLAAFVGGALMIFGGRRLKVVKLVEGHGVWISGVDAGCLSKHFQPAPRECWEAA